MYRFAPPYNKDIVQMRRCCISFTILAAGCRHLKMFKCGRLIGMIQGATSKVFEFITQASGLLLLKEPRMPSPPSSTQPKQVT